MILFFAVLAPVDLFFGVGKHEDMLKLLFDGGDTSGVFAADHVGDLLWQMERFLFNDLRILDDIYSDIMVDKSKDIKIHKIYGAFDLHNVLFTHFAALCIFYNSHAAVQLVQMKVFVNVHAPSGLDMIQHEAFFNTSDS